MGKSVFFSWALIVIFHVVAMAFSWYDRLLWLDILMHLIGGAWVGLLFVYLFPKYLPGYSEARFLSYVILGLGFVTLIGVFWEFYEYLSDVYIYKMHPLNLAPNPKNLPDTLADLVNDLIGGSVVIAWAFFRKKLLSTSSST